MSNDLALNGMKNNVELSFSSGIGFIYETIPHLLAFSQNEASSCYSLPVFSQTRGYKKLDNS